MGLFARWGRVPSLVVLAGALLLGSEPRAVAGDTDPEKAFHALVEKCKSGTDEEKATLLPDAMARDLRLDGEALLRWRKDLVEALAAAKTGDVRQDGKTAVVRFTTSRPGEEWEWSLTLKGETWTPAGPVLYMVKGPELSEACGKKPETLDLLPRDPKDGDYGRACSFSFVHGTSDASSIKNRICLWYGPCGHLHASDRIARVRAANLEKVDGIPVGVNWKSSLVPEKGGVYVLHTKRAGHRDFYVKIQVLEVGGKRIRMAWSLLTTGYGSPASIHRSTPMEPNPDGADGADAMCRQGAPEKPEPLPPPPGTKTPTGK